MRPLQEPPGQPPETLFDLPLGDRLKERGQHAALGADAAWQWRRAAMSTIARLATTGLPFTADDLVRRVGLPRHGTNQNNAVGALFTSAAKRKWIVKTGDYRRSKRTAAHARMIAVWVGNPDTDLLPGQIPDPFPWPNPNDNPGGTP